MPNYDGFYEVTAWYDVTISSRAFTHKLTFDVNVDSDLDPGTPANDWEVYTKNSLAVPLDTAVDDMFDLLWPLMGTGTSQPRFELWKYGDEPSLDKSFKTAWEGNITYDLGATAAIAAHQTTMTFRSQLGGSLRIQLMEDKISLETKVPFPTSGSDGAFGDYMLSNACIVIARDGGYPIARLNACYGQNEKLKRKRFRTV